MERKPGTGKRNVTLDSTIKALKKAGFEVSREEAEIIHDFLYLLGNITVERYMKGDNKASPQHL